VLSVIGVFSLANSISSCIRGSVEAMVLNSIFSCNVNFISDKLCTFNVAALLLGDESSLAILKFN